jgi:hypothetical protein
MKVIGRYRVHHSDVRCPCCGEAGMQRVVWEYNTGVLRRVRECPACGWSDIKDNFRADVNPSCGFGDQQHEVGNSDCEGCWPSEFPKPCKKPDCTGLVHAEDGDLQPDRCCDACGSITVE